MSVRRKRSSLEELRDEKAVGDGKHRGRRCRGERQTVGGGEALRWSAEGNENGERKHKSAKQGR